MNDLLLIAADLDERRLLYAELLEAGYSVLSLPDIAGVTRWLSRGLSKPSLVLLDMGHDGQPSVEAVERLLAETADVPLILVVPAAASPAWQRLSSRPAAVLHRPISIGEIVEAVRSVLPPIATC